MQHVCITFMYGMAIPVLFPITLVALINIYITDRLLLAYYFTQPEQVGLELHVNCMKNLKLAPFMMFIFGYWAMGNR